MKKLKTLAITAVAVTAMSTAALIINTSCRNEHVHIYGDYIAAGENGHYRNAICNGHENLRTETEAHVYSDGGTVCLVCGYEKSADSANPSTPSVRPSDGFEVPVNAVSLIITGAGKNAVQLSYENRSHSVNRGAIKIFINENTVEDPVIGGEVPAENFTLTLTDPQGNACEDWSDLRLDGEYVLTAKLTNCVAAEGADFDVNEICGAFGILVRNRIISTSLSVKEGAVLTQPKSVTDRMTGSWQYEVFRENGDSVDVPTEAVTVSGLQTNVIAESAAAELKCGEYTGSVVYCITENPDIHLRSRAVEFSDLKSGEVADGSVLLDKEEVKISVVGGATAVSEPLFTEDRYFGGSLRVDGLGGEYVRINVVGETDLTVFWRAAKGEGGVLVYSDSASAALSATPQVPIYFDSATDEKPRKSEIRLPSAGSYLLTASGEVDFYSVRANVWVENADLSDLPPYYGEPKAVELTVKGAETVSEFASGDIFTVDDGLSFVCAFVTSITGELEFIEITEGLTFTLCGLPVIPKDTELTAELFHEFGETAVTVSYGGVSAEYMVKLLPPPLTGVDGIAVEVSESFGRTVFEESETLLLRLSDLSFSVSGTAVDGASVTDIAAYCVYADGVKKEIPESGLAICAGEYTIEAEATVSRGYSSGWFTAECALVITVDDTLKNLSAADGIASLAVNSIDERTVLASSHSGSIAVNATPSKNVKAEDTEEYFEDAVYSKRLNFSGGGSEYGSVEFEVESECVIALYISAKEFSEVTFVLSDSMGELYECAVDGTEEIMMIRFTVDAPAVYRVYSLSGAFRLYDAEIIYN